MLPLEGRTGQAQSAAKALMGRADPASDRWTQSLLRIEAVEILARDQGDWALAGDIAKQMRRYAPGYAGTHYGLAKESEHEGNVEAANPH